MDKNFMDNLNSIIFNWVIEHGKEPNHIVINPNTWQYFVSELSSNDEHIAYCYELTNNNKYKGYNIIRSFDVEENRFILG